MPHDELRWRTWITQSIEKPGLDSGRLHFGKRLGTSLPSGWQLLGNDRALSYRRCPSGKPSSSAVWRNAPAVRLVSVEIFATGVLAREWALSSWTCCFVHARRFRRPSTYLLFFAMRKSSCGRAIYHKMMGDTSAWCAIPAGAMQEKTAPAKASQRHRVDAVGARLPTHEVTQKLFRRLMSASPRGRPPRLFAALTGPGIPNEPGPVYWLGGKREKHERQMKRALLITTGAVRFNKSWH